MTDEEFAEWVEEHLTQVDARLSDVIAPQTDFVREAANYLISLSSKRFRPAMVIAAGGLGPRHGGSPAVVPGGSPRHAARSEMRSEAEVTLREVQRSRSAQYPIANQALIDSAVVVELTHVASLYHDDVMDEAPVRRGAASANVRWGNSVAVMIGDFLLATASLVGSTLGEAFVAHQSRTLARLVQGQIAELRGPRDGADPVAHHLSVLADKTASLIAASARYGGMVAGLGADELDELTAFGETVGVCFQLADDLIDITSTDSGKTVGTDLREGVLTMAPLMIISENHPEDARLVELLSAPVAEADIPEALSLLKVHPTIDKVRQYIIEQVAQATSHLEIFPDSAAKRALLALADQAVHRTN